MASGPTVLSSAVGPWASIQGGVLPDDRIQIVSYVGQTQEEGAQPPSCPSP